MEQTEVEWAPMNGERVWIKVFSNWSLGTYIGFDTTKGKHLVREDADGGGNLMLSSQVLPESDNPNLPAEELTAVEWYDKEINSLFELYKTTGISHGAFITLKHDLFCHAKKMEEQEKAEFALRAYDEKLSTGKKFVSIVNERSNIKSE